MKQLSRIVILAALTQVLACRPSGADHSSDESADASKDTIPYTILSVDTTDGDCLARFKECPNVQYSYPVFSGPDTALNGFLNRLVLEQFRAGFQEPKVVSPSEYANQFFREHREGRKSFANEDGPSWAWFQQLQIRVVAWKGQYVCLARDWSAYTGGAHSMYDYRYLNVDLENKELLQVVDLLDTGDTKLRQLGELRFRHDLQIPDSLSLKEAGYFAWESEATAPNKDPLAFRFNDNFGITDTGITFLYNPYEIAAYASGTPEFTIPYASLKPFLKRPIAE